MTTAQEILELQEKNIDIKIDLEKNYKRIRYLEADNSLLLRQWEINLRKIKELSLQHDRQTNARSV